MQSIIKTFGHNIRAKLFDALWSFGHRLLQLLAGLTGFYVAGAIAVVVSAGTVGQIVNPLTCNGIGLVVVGMLAFVVLNCVYNLSELLIEQTRASVQRVFG